jgi:hypothetical protein
MGWCILVNTGDTDITHEDVSTAVYEVVSSEPDMWLDFYSSFGSAWCLPVVPGHAIGGVTVNTVLLTQLQPDETFCNQAERPTPSFCFTLRRLNLSFTGPVVYDATVTIAGRVAYVRIHMNVFPGDEPSMSFPSAARVNSVPSMTPVVGRSWGHLKSLYR